MAEGMVDVAVIAHNLKVKSVVTVLCLVHQNSAQHTVKNVLVAVRQATMENAVIQTCRTMLEDVEEECKGGKSMVLVRQSHKDLIMLMNRTTVATYMIQTLLFLRCIS